MKFIFLAPPSIKELFHIAPLFPTKSTNVSKSISFAFSSEHIVFCIEIGVAHAFRGRLDFRRSDSGPRHEALDGRRDVQIVRTESRIREIYDEGRLGERFFRQLGDPPVMWIGSDKTMTPVKTVTVVGIFISVAVPLPSVGAAEAFPEIRCVHILPLHRHRQAVIPVNVGRRCRIILEVGNHIPVVGIRVNRCVQRKAPMQLRCVS